MSEWTPERIKKARENWEQKKPQTAKTENSAKQENTGKVTGNSPSAGRTNAAGMTTNQWTPERIQKARETWEAKATTSDAGSAGTSVRSTGNSGSLGATVLAQMTGGQTGTNGKTGGSKLQLAVPQEKKAADTKARPGLAKTAGTSVQRGGNAQPEWLTKPQPKKPAAQKATAPAATVRGTVKPTADQRAQARRNGNAGILAKGAQALKDHAEKAEAEDKFSDFTRLNQWMDADPKHRELVDLMRMTGNQLENATGIRETSWATQDTGGKTPKYTDADLLKKGYSTDEIKEARQYIAEYDALPTWEKAARRTADSWKGIGGAVASFIPQLGENLGMAIWNIEKSANNRKALAAEVEKNPREKNLYDRLMETDMDYRPKYSTGDLLQQGFTRQEIENMRARIAGTEEKDSLDPDESVGYQLSDYGRKHTERAQAGMSESAKLAMGIVTSAAENLAVAGISPALVLPVLSAQGGAESMGQSIERGDSAGKTLAGGLAKFGAGWAINSVGAADLARTMGSDYAKDTLAGKLADVVRSVADNGTLAQQYPTIANTISGGVDNAMQAFVETYADMAIDVALGDADAAANLYKPETFLQALESGLTGGASGALGGAVGTQLGKMRAAMETEGTQAGNELPQSPAGDSSLREGALETAERQAAANDRQVGNAAQPAEDAAVLQQTGAPAANEAAAEQTAVNDDPAVHTPAQNASIEEYKQSVDPGLAEYVDRVRAGETPEPYMVTETSDRMRDAMQQLTGLDKVGSRTLMDANAVKHITNRHAGGDGSADGTMKESADVARAAYVLNNFDNAYLAKDRADGYKTSKGKSSPIVMFEKKIDGSHIVVEAVLDTKRGNNYIVTEYLAKNGVDKEKVARALRSSVSAASDPELYVRNVAAANSATTESVQAPMDAASDPRHTSETLTAHSSADTTVSQRAGDVNSRRVENTGETVESPAAQAVKELAKRWRVSDAAAESMSRNMPEGVGAEVYAPAAASLYRLGVNGEGESFADALQMTGSGALSGAVRQVLATGETGRLALEMAYTQGKGEAERYKETKAAELGKRPGAAALREDAGTLYSGDGTESGSRRAGDELIRLTAGANGLAAQRVTEGIRNRAKGLIQSSIGKVFYSGDADTATVLHETFHAANSWDSAGAQEMIDTFEHYLVKQNGMDSVMQLVESYLDRYEKAGQSLTYNQAMEEITADAMQSIFGSEESFKNFLRQQALEAQANAGALGKCQRVMEKIGAMLEKVLADIKNLLVKEPTNAAARAAKTLTETQLKDLQQIWMKHQMDAGEAYRAALEANGGANKNAADGKTAAEGEKYSIDPDYAEKIDEWDKEGRDNSRTFILGRTGDALQSLGARENDIYMKADKINTILKEHPEMTLEEIKRIPEILDDPVMILTSQNKGRTKQNTRLVMFGDVKAQDGRPVLCVLDLRPVENHIVISDMQKVTSAYTKDVNPVEFVRKSDVLYVDENKERTTELFRTLGFKIPSELQLSGSIGRITYGNQDVKLSGVKFTELEVKAPVKKNVRMQIAEADEVEKLSAEQQALSEQQKALKEERTAWLESAEVKAVEAKKKALGNFSAQAKAYRESEEYQSYIAKRKDYNSRLAQLEEQSAALGDRMREAGERLQARADAKANDRQLAYNAEAEKHGGKAEYRRQLAKERFGVTEDFKKAGYILPDGKMLNFAQSERTRDTDHRAIREVFGPAETKTGTEALNEFLLDGNVRVMAEGPGIDLSADTEPTAQQLEQIRKMVDELSGERGQFILDISTADGRVAASKAYSGSVDADKVVREIRDYYRTGELAQESELAKFRYQLDVDSEDVEAAKEAQMGSGRAAGETIQKVMEQAQNARVSDDSLLYIARKMVKASASRMDAKTLASRLAALRDYMNGGNVDWAQAHGFVLDMAQQIMEKSAKKNDELWKAYPELHEMGMSLAKGSKDYNEVLYKYGSWAEARRELARHGVKLTLTKDGTESRWDADFPELQKLGAGLFPEETPSSAADALEAMAAAHDAIRPTMESAYDSDWDAAKQEMAMEIWGEYLGLPGIASGKNAALRAEFAEKRKEMNTAARKQAVRLQAEANLAAAKQRASDRQKMRQPYTDMAAKAQADYREAETKLRAELGAKEMKLEQQAAMQREAERGRAREKVAIARAKNEQRLAQMRESRDKDNTRRAIRKVTGELTKLYEHPKEGSYIPEYLLDKVMPVLQLANEVTGNRETAERLANWRHRGEESWHYTPMQDTKTGLNDAVSGLRRGIAREMEAGDRANLEWEQSGLTDAIDNWLADVNDNREREIARLEATMRNARKWGDEYGGIDGTAMEAYLNALQEELDSYRSGGMAALSATELRGLRDILEQTAHIIKIDNVVVGAQEDAMIDDFAEGAKSELAAAKGVSKKRGLLGKMNRAFNSYRMNTMNIERMFERLGGYDHGGYIENLGQMLNDGQRKKTKILIEGERIFDNVTGKEHEKELYHYIHDLADVGFRDASGKARKITHDQMAELWLQLQNPQGLHHILHGGVTLEDMEARLSGDTELAQLNRETVRVGELNLRDAEGKLIDLRDIDMDETAVRRSLLEELDKNLTDYDRAWIDDYKKMNAKMSGYINETSLLLSGTRKATTENYIHINVDEDANPEQNKGIRYDNSVGNPGWLNHRVNSSKPVLLVGLAQQVNTSIRNTAQYAGMAVPLRNAEKILNSMQEGKTLFKQVEDTWGKAGREYLNKALADLCEVKDSREVGDGFFARLRSNAAQAVLSANVNVTLLQAASLPTAAAELGWRSTGAAAVQFGANILDPMNIAQFFGSKGDSALTRIEARMREHGDELLQYRLRGTGTAELGSAGAQKGAFGRAHDAARNSGNALVSGAVHAADKAVSLWTGGITKMDEITVAALWAGSESYVKNHPEEFSAGAEVTDSPAYWAAVNEKFERVVERTQPNYTAMQRTGYQRTKNEMAKFLMMFSTQRQQNAQIWTASVEDMLAQYERYGKSGTAEAKAEIQKANERFLNAATSQVVQTAVIALMGIGVKFFLHRWKDLQDDNGDMTAKSIADAFLYDYLKSYMGNWTGGSEVMSAGEMILNHSFTSYDTISMTGISAINDLTEAIGKVYQLNAEDTSGMTEAQLETHKQKTAEAVADMLGQFGMLRGIPYTNLKKQAQAVSGWMDTAANWSKDGGNFDGLPASATSQYDRLYNAYVSGDKEEAQAAAKKLDQMVQAGAIAENKMYDQLKTRLKKYDGRVREAAQQTNAGNWEARKDIVDEVTGELKKLLNTDDPDVHDTVVGAVDAAANEMLATEKGYDKSAGIYAGLRDAVDSWNAQNVQEEYDRLVRAGKDAGNIRKKITELAKPDYLAGSDADKEQMADVLLSLTDADGNALYTEKNFSQWEKAADKAAEKEAEAAQNPDRRDLLK